MEFYKTVLGNPADFATVIENLGIRDRLNRYQGRPRFVVNAGFLPFPPEQRLFTAWFGGWGRGWIQATSRPDGKTELWVVAKDEDWPELEPLWQMIEAELDRLGMVEQPARTVNQVTSKAEPRGAEPLAVIENDDYRELVRQWREGHTAGDIAAGAGISPGRVRNILTELRKQHGKDVVPFHRS